MTPTLSKLLVYYPLYALMGKDFHSTLSDFNKTQWFPRQVLAKRQMELAKKRLQHAHAHIPYYRRLLEAHDVSPEKINSIDDMRRIPILTRADITSNFDDLVDPQHRRRLYLRETSGSTGTPLRLYKDPESIAVMDAIMYRNYAWYNIDIGARQARFWGAPLSGRGRVKIALKDFLLNRIRFSPFDLRDDVYEDCVEALFRFKPLYVYGYAQTIYGFSEFVLNNAMDLAPLRLRTVIITGEMVTREQIATIGAAFKSPVSNEYGCTEVGIIAMECPQKSMHLMIENLLIEFIRNGRHVEPEEEGEIIITELYGSAMPLIRYQVGDIGSYTPTECDCGRGMPLLHNLKGRSDEFIVCPNGKRVDPIVFEYILKEIPSRLGDVTRFRITQRRKDMLEVEICYSGNRYEELAQTATERLRKVLGDDFEFEFRSVDSITAEPSGKLRCFISRLEG